MSETIFTLADKRKDPALKRIGRLMLHNRSGFIHIGQALRHSDSYLAFSQLPINGWSVGIILPVKTLFSDVAKLQNVSLIVASGGLVLLVLVSLGVAGTIVRPIRQMVRATSQIARGNLDISLPQVQRKDEVGQLAGAFSQMAVDLNQYIQDLTETTALNQRIETELNVAAQIQESLLPTNFHGFTTEDDCEVFAVMNPAREVGGDFYDFFMIDSNRLYVAIGDVSGKGVPAALFMSTVISALRSCVRYTTEPHAILNHLNLVCSQGNETYMFVTLFCGIIDLHNGKFSYANAGHDPPWLLKDNSKVLPLEKPNGPAIGLITEAQYTSSEVMLTPGDTIFTYTDGLTEAMNVQGDLFTKEKLVEILTTISNGSVKGIVDRVLIELSEFTSDTDKMDDTTMLSFRLNQFKKM